VFPQRKVEHQDNLEEKSPDDEQDIQSIEAKPLLISFSKTRHNVQGIS
jgi:hypothetical protein